MKMETDIVQMFERDRETRILLEAVATLDLPDWWICAGYVRAKIWDVLDKRKRQRSETSTSSILIHPTRQKRLTKCWKPD